MSTALPPSTYLKFDISVSGANSRIYSRSKKRKDISRVNAISEMSQRSLALFLVFGNVMKHYVLFLIYYISKPYLFLDWDRFF